ncbi:hypothetical protein QD357_11640 [Rhizobium sp. BR 317]|uniref:hypothetical protein n=1 Tax=Rhizobium sp. BR 317 TaxID=3040015 RepID=UPI0039BF1396
MCRNAMLQKSTFDGRGRTHLPASMEHLLEFWTIVIGAAFDVLKAPNDLAGHIGADGQSGSGAASR